MSGTEHYSQDRRAGDAALAAPFAPGRLEPGRSRDPLVAALLRTAELAGAEVLPDRVPAAELMSTEGSGLPVVAEVLGIPLRKVSLRPRWHRRLMGQPLIALRDDGVPVTLVSHNRGWRKIDPATGVATPIGRRPPTLVECYGCYGTLPSGTGLSVFTRFARRIGASRDYTSVIGYAAALAVLSALLPVAYGVVLGIVTKHVDTASLVGVGIVLAAAAIASYFIALGQGIAILRLTSRLDTQITAGIWDRLLRLPIPFFSDFAAGDLTGRVLALQSAQAGFSGALVVVVTATLTLVAAIAVLLFVHPISALAVLFVVILAVLSAVPLVRRLVQAQVDSVDAAVYLNGLTSGLLDGIAKIRVSGAEDQVRARWASSFAAQQLAERDRMRALSGLAVLFSVLPGIGLMVVFLALGPVGQPAIPVFAVAAGAVGMVAGATASLIPVASQAASASAALRSSQPIIEATVEERAGRGLPGTLSGRITLSHVTFGFQSGRAVLQDLSLDIAPGEFLAIVGPSGAGKSTLIDMILGYHTPWNGTVAFDGEDLRRLDPVAVRQQIGSVLQQIDVPAGSLIQAILGASGADEAAAWEAAAAVGLEAEIQQLPMGMQTFMPENGSVFSVGQLQRIMLARALVAEPRILLLDEATSALDNRTQEHVSRGLAALGCTRVVVAHRLSTIRQADRLVVLDAGRIVEVGTYDELIVGGTHFQRLARPQTI